MASMQRSMGQVAPCGRLPSIPRIRIDRLITSIDIFWPAEGEGWQVKKAAIRRKRGSYQRGEDTRRRMVETAMDLFAAHGFEGVSTRSLAEAAGVNLPAIQYYFGGKEGLFRAAVDRIIQRIAERMEPAADRASAVLAEGEVPCRILLERLYEMLDAFLALMLDDQRPEREKLFIVRAEIERSSMLEPLHQTLQRYTFGPCTALVARLIRCPVDDEKTIARTLAILGQIVIFGHKSPHRTIGWGDHTEPRVKMVQALLHEHTAAILGAARAAGS
jgi:AcrR family transcriptional regulator